jgi:DNA primase
MESPPTDDTIVEKNFTDNVRRIKEKWYKDQHRQIKLKLAHAQESGNEEILNSLLHEKKELIKKERELS